MSLDDEQEIERLRAQADRFRDELAVLCNRLLLEKAQTGRLQSLMSEAIRLLDDAVCTKDDRLNREIWANRRRDLIKRLNFEPVRLYEARD